MRRIALSLAALAGSVALCTMHVRTTVKAQILHAIGPLPSYEVATIKPFLPSQALGVNRRPGVVVYVGSVKQLIGIAYNLPPLSTAQVAGAASWTAQDLYVVEGKIDDPQFVAMQRMTERQSHEQGELLLQSLLAKRLNLKVHFETRDLPEYALVIAKGGTKLHPSAEIPDASDSVLPPPIAPGETPSLANLRKGFFAMPQGAASEMQAKGLNLDELAQMLQRQPDAGGRLIVNRTGLPGYFDCSMRWAHELATTSAAESVGLSSPNEPPFFTALREQLGLRLIPTRGPTEVIVVDHVERPSEN